MKPTFSKLSMRYTNFARLFIVLAFLCAFFSPQFSGVARADATEDAVLDILAILNQYASGSVGFWTYPRSPNGYNLSRYLWTGMFDGSGPDGVPSSSSSYMRQIRNDLRTLLSDSTNGVSHQLQSEQLDALNSINSLLSDIYYLGGIYQTLSDHAYDSTMWHTHVDDSQIDDIISAIAGVSINVDVDCDCGGGGDDPNEPPDHQDGHDTNDVVSVDFSDVLDKLDALSNAVAIGPASDTGSASTGSHEADLYGPEPDMRSPLQELTLDEIQVSGIDGILDEFGNLDVDILPSLTGADSRLTILSQGTAGLESDFVVDLALPPNVERAFSAFSLWLWRILFAVSVWWILRDEYGYWSTLGGSAS